MARARGELEPMAVRIEERAGHLAHRSNAHLRAVVRAQPAALFDALEDALVVGEGQHEVAMLRGAIALHLGHLHDDDVRSIRGLEGRIRRWIVRPQVAPDRFQPEVVAVELLRPLDVRDFEQHLEPVPLGQI